MFAIDSFTIFGIRIKYNSLDYNLLMDKILAPLIARFF